MESSRNQLRTISKSKADLSTFSRGQKPFKSSRTRLKRYGEYSAKKLSFFELFLFVIHFCITLYNLWAKLIRVRTFS